MGFSKQPLSGLSAWQSYMSVAEPHVPEQQWEDGAQAWLVSMGCDQMFVCTLMGRCEWEPAAEVQ